MTRPGPQLLSIATAVCLAIIGVWIWQAAARDNSLENAIRASCERGNVIRAELNQRAQAVRAFAVEMSVEATPEQASAYTRLAASYRTVPLVNCRKAARNETENP
jgi:hypothetical protein